MVSFLTDVGTSFVLGLLTPLTAVCVLPLYPGFLTFITSQLGAGSTRKTYALIGAIITLGVILFMILLGLVFTTLFQASLTNVVGVISPIAFGILFVISILLIIDLDFSKFMPKVHSPMQKNPYLSALTFGFFFGAIVIPCNPAFIAAFFARAATVTSFASNMVSFIAFGFGLGFPLLVFSLVSSGKSTAIIAYLTLHKRKINLVAGILMLVISVYYLLCIFTVFGDFGFIPAVCKPLSNFFVGIVSAGGSILPF